jgi:hypothetical protein
MSSRQVGGKKITLESVWEYKFPQNSMQARITDFIVKIVLRFETMFLVQFN